MKALIATETGSVALSDIPEPRPGDSQAVIRVTASSINRGDLVTLRLSAPGIVLGLDVVGVVEEPAADGTGPERGTRVMGYTGSRAGAWAETTVVDTALVTEIPETLSDAAAAALPNGGLAALTALEAAGPMLGARVLVTGVTGGVGRLAAQLAHLAGAVVAGTVTSPQRAHSLSAFPWLAPVALTDATGPYDLIIDLVGGESLTHALRVVAPHGVVASLAQTAPETAQIPPFWFGTHAGAHLVSIVNGVEQVRTGRGIRNLQLLAHLTAQGELDPGISVEKDWTEAPELLDELARRKITGKAIIRMQS